MYRMQWKFPSAVMQAERRCLQTFRHDFNPYRKRRLFSQAAKRGPLAGYRKNTAVAGLRKIPIHLLRLNLQLRSLHYSTQLNTHTAKMAELTHPTIKDGKIL
jgi:hypothetical protein